MLFRQLFDHTSHTYTYLLASDTSHNAIIIDPVLEQTPCYLQLLKELNLNLIYTIDTHTHADHITASGQLAEELNCQHVMGENTKAQHVAIKLKDGETLTVDDIKLNAIYTPGHTDDSYSFIAGDRVFTGDTLLIRSTGQTDFQSGSPQQQYDSIFNKLLELPGDTLVYPAHDYNGMTVSSIAEEKHHNPHLQVGSADDYAKLMSDLNLNKPNMMDIAVPANLQSGLLTNYNG